jgi:hypothetical protein
MLYFKVLQHNLPRGLGNAVKDLSHDSIYLKREAVISRKSITPHCKASSLKLDRTWPLATLMNHSRQQTKINVPTSLSVLPKPLFKSLTC